MQRKKMLPFRHHQRHPKTHTRTGLKPKPYESDVSEIHTFKDPSINPESAKVFNTVFRMTPEAERHGYEAVKNLDDEKVHEAFRNSGLSNWEKLHDTFKARKQNYLDHYEK